jgi:PrcB C-terminal
MRLRRLIYLWCVMVVSAASASGLSIAFEVLKIDARFSGTEVPLFTAIRSRDEWRSLRSKLISLHQRDSTPLDLPSASEIDFSRYTMVVAALGIRPNNGYNVVIRDVYDGISSIGVGVIELVPGRGCATGQVLTYPMTIVLIPRSTKPVVFNANRASVDCKPLRYSGDTR